MILTLRKLEHEEAEGQYGPYVRYDAFFKERKEKASIFQNDNNGHLIDALEALRPGETADFTLEAKQSGRYVNYTILDILPATGQPTTDAPLQQATTENRKAYQEAQAEKVPAEVWSPEQERARSMALSYAKDLALALKLEGNTQKLSEAVVAVARRFTQYITEGT